MSWINFRHPLSERGHMDGSNPMGSQMRHAKERLEKTVNALTDKAKDCFDLANTQHRAAGAQHVLADRQHENAGRLDVSADRLEILGEALTADAIELKGDLEIVAQRTSERLQLLLRAAPALPVVDPK
jgi:hypothetical protein